MITYGIRFDCDLCPAQAITWAEKAHTTPPAWENLPTGWDCVIVRTHPTRMRVCRACIARAREYQAAYRAWRVQRWEALRANYTLKLENANILARIWEHANPPPTRPRR